MSSISYRKGAVSIFVVIFTALLITVVTVSFVRLMVRDQQRASDNDLSKSAYDSALAGVEDAKRALSRLYSLAPADQASYDLTTCNAITGLLTGTASSDEVAVQTNLSADAALQQAYTCVRVYTTTNDYDRALRADETALVPLQTRPGTQFNQVRVQWFIQTDLAEGVSVNLPSGTSVLSEVWPDGRPPVIEAQLIQTGPDFHLDQFDGQPGGDQNTNTLLLYPKNITTAPTTSFNSDVRRTPKTTVTDARCTPTFEARFLCSAMIALPAPIGGDAGSRANAYLRITPRYRSTQVSVSAYDNTTLVPLEGVQPRIDSTGRANDLFRRISVRVESGTDVVYPSGAVDISGSFCKTFTVADQPDDYSPGDCTP